MNDTHESSASRFTAMIMEQSPERRVMMGFSMFDAAKRLAMCDITGAHPAITPRGLREQLFLRFYGREFNKARREKILKALRNSGRPGMGDR
jgi:hypothetical protein